MRMVGSRPYPTGYPMIESEYVCGFSTLDQLVNWFSDTEIKKLEELGFHLAVYQAEFVLHGKYQIMFHKPTAVKE